MREPSQRADRGDGGYHRRADPGRARAPHRPLGSRCGHYPPGRRHRPIADLQIEYSLISRGIEDRILPATRELGIGITAYGVLSRGLISGHYTRDRQLAANDFRAYSPRFQGENLQHNLDRVEALRKIAEQKGVTVAQIAVAWVLSRGEDIVPPIGARCRDRLTEALGALDVTLIEADLAAVEETMPAGAAAGERYPGA
jgi:aryl-alcohol dehydrogenase-like predicted oxidoreductase